MMAGGGSPVGLWSEIAMGGPLAVKKRIKRE